MQTDRAISILAVSDNHGDWQILEDIRRKYPNCDYYFHLGDSEMDPEELEGWICVQGNNDIFYGTIPLERVLEIGEHRILLVHGHHDMVWQDSLEELQAHALKQNCDIVFFGHTHAYFDRQCKNVRLLNPGSTSRPRSMKDGGTCMYVLLKGKEVEVHKIELEEVPPRESQIQNIIQRWKKKKKQ